MDIIMTHEQTDFDGFASISFTKTTPFFTISVATVLLLITFTEESHLSILKITPYSIDWLFEIFLKVHIVHLDFQPYLLFSTK